MASVKVKVLDRQALEPLLALYRQLIEDDLPLSNETARLRYEEMLGRDGLSVCGSFADGFLASTCTLIVVPNLTRGGMSYAFVENVVTDAAHRRKGLGQAVVKAAIDDAFAAGCYTVRLLTGAKRPGTLEFYKECGFEALKHGLEVRRIPPR